jgi:sugar transferase (PEP-CTERM/EpsH1 system associated)
MRRLYILLREMRPDIVHTRNLNALEAQFVAAAARVPARVHGEHGRDVFDLEGKNWKYNVLRRAARPWVNQYITVSRDLAAWLRQTVGVSGQRLNQIYNGVDSDKFHPREAARPEIGPAEFLAGASCVIGSVGRMVAVKDYPTLVRAFIHACQQGEKASGLRLLLVGDGPSKPECESLLQQSGFADRAWLAGNRNDTADLMRIMDVFVLPSLGEGISNTILEAMSTGLPVVATDVGGNPELVTPAETGALFMPGAAEALAKTLLDYAADPARIAREGRAARVRVERDFSLERMVDRYRAVYRAALGQA